jgi:hypothetical protein
MNNITLKIIILFACVMLVLPLLSVENACAIDDYELQKHSMLGAGVRYSSDKPSFKGRAKSTKKTKKVVEATKEDPMDGGLITKNMFGNVNNTTKSGYHYKYKNKYHSPVLFSNKSTDILCPECRARAVLDACKMCKGKSFEELCDKCKARAILNACDKCKAKIREGLKESKEEN